ncbi:MAG: phosphoribosyltransferase family protein [Thermomicrobiales bacterium]
MTRLAILENGGTPTDRWSIRASSLDGVDFAQEAAAIFGAIAANAVVAFEIGVNARGDFVDARAGLPDPVIIEQYSRMKYGDLDAVSFFARQLADRAMQSERFLAHVRDAATAKRVVYITTAAVFNVPSASNLLLRATAAHLNILLTRQELAPVVVTELTRLSDNSLGYESTAVRERRDNLAAGRGVTIVPAYFHNECVIYLDDLFSTGYSIWRAKHRLQNVGVASSFYLLAARMDPQAVGASQGQIEDRLNDYFVSETLQSFAPLLRGGHFAVVQKLVRALLDPLHTNELPAFLAGIQTPAILKLYAAAASDGFSRRSQGRYLPSLLALEMVLQERGVLDAAGHITGTSRDLAALYR